ncbi:MAG: tetratricopeptide repeat protein [Kiritimatiellia bacterium]|nr:tetratricopeptide repeat protein [Lentisphaerota bacterium]
MKRIRLVLLFMAACFTAASTGLADQPADDLHAPLRIYLQAYESMSMAEWLQEQEMSEEAVDMYNEALALFLGLIEQHPAWQSELVDFRIRHCRQMLDRLAPSSAPPAYPPLPAAPPAAPQPAPVRPLPAPAAPRPTPGMEQVRNTALLRRAIQLEQVSDWKEAAELYDEMLATAPNHTQALQGLARIHLRLGQFDQAREILLQRAQSADSDEATLLLRVLLLCHDGQFEEAHIILETIIKRNPWHPHAHLAMGVVWTQAGRLDAAAEATKRAISLNPRLGDAYYNLAQISLRQTPVDLAVTRAHYRNALKYGANPDSFLETLLK